MTAVYSSRLDIVKIFSLIGHNLDFPETKLHLISPLSLFVRMKQLHKQLMMHQQKRVTKWILLLKG